MSIAEPYTSIRVRKVAQVIKLFSPEERIQLLELVPELQKTETTSVLRESVTNYYLDGLSAQRNGGTLNLDAPFLAGLTYGDYLALPEEEEIDFWDKVFAQIEREIC